MGLQVLPDQRGGSCSGIITGRFPILDILLSSLVYPFIRCIGEMPDTVCILIPVNTGRAGADQQK